jgi:hypothetical protein
MAVIDRSQLLTDTKTYLPDSNVLEDTTISAIIDNVVGNVIPSDDDIYYNQALCETLYRCGAANLSKASVDSVGKNKEKVGQVEIGWSASLSKDGWKDYIESLRDFCPLVLNTPFPVSSIGILINPSDPVVINDCPCPDDLYL